MAPTEHVSLFSTTPWSSLGRLNGFLQFAIHILFWIYKPSLSWPLFLSLSLVPSPESKSTAVINDADSLRLRQTCQVALWHRFCYSVLPSPDEHVTIYSSLHTVILFLSKETGMSCWYGPQPEYPALCLAYYCPWFQPPALCLPKLLQSFLIVLTSPWFSGLLCLLHNFASFCMGLLLRRRAL